MTAGDGVGIIKCERMEYTNVSPIQPCGTNRNLGGVMTVYVIADIQVTDDSWVPDYATNVHDTYISMVASICRAAAISRMLRANRRSRL